MSSADPEVLGPYRIVRRVGVGGMGVVYEAVHTGLEKRVALKVLPRELAAGRLDRFLREARTAAALHHTNIVPVFDVGQVDGVPYYAMQFIDGRPLGTLDRATVSALPADVGGPTRTHEPRASATRSFTAPPTVDDPASGSAASTAGFRPPSGARLRQVVGLVLQAAEGLAHAHARGIVHRDVKPSNLLVDDSGVVWVADFGLAFRADDPTLTTEGAILGTPRYMSPEQAQAQKTDARSDVYSLGVTLYELLTGRAAFGGDTPMSVIRNVIHATPPPPRAFNRDVPRDLETVVLKAMARSPDDRYPTARELADDLRRFLAGEPVKARRISSLGRAWRWAKRNPAVASLLAAVVLVFAGGAAAAGYYAERAGEREREARRNHQKADVLLGELGRSISDLHAEKRKLLDAEAENARLVYAARISLAGVALRENDHARVAELLRETLPKPGEPDPRGWEWHYLFRTVFPESKVEAAGPAVAAREVYRTGEELVVWEPKSLKELLRLPLAGHRDSSPPVLDAAGKLLARFAPEAEPPAVEVWDVETGKRLAALPLPRRFGSTYSDRESLLSAGGRWLAVLIDGRRVVVWDVPAGTVRVDRLLPAPRGPSPTAPRNPGLALGADRWLAARAVGGERVEVFDLASGDDAPAHSFAEFAGAVDAVAVSPDGRGLAAADSAGAVTLFDLAGGAPPWVLRTTHGDLRALTFSADGRTLAARSGARRIEWDLTRPPVDRLTGEPPRARAVGGGAVRPGGRAVALAGLWQGQFAVPSPALVVRDLELRAGRSLTPPVVHDSEAIRSVSWSADGRLVAAVTALSEGPRDAVARFRFVPPALHPASAAVIGRLAWERVATTVVLVIDADAGRVVRTVVAPAARPVGARLSPCGRWVAVETADGFVVYAVADGRPVFDSREPGRAAGAFTSDGGRFVLARGGDRVRFVVRDLAAGTEERREFAGGGAARVSPDGRWVVVADGGRVVARDAATGGVAAEIESGPPADDPRRPHFSPDGRWLVVPDGPRAAAVHATASWERKFRAAAGAGDPPELMFAPDGRRVLELHSGPNGQTLRVLDAATGQELLGVPCSPRRAVRPALPAYFDGERLVLVRQYLPAGDTEVETLAGAPAPDDLARERLGLK